jgi:hypothetical protein
MHGINGRAPRLGEVDAIVERRASSVDDTQENHSRQLHPSTASVRNQRGLRELRHRPSSTRLAVLTVSPWPSGPSCRLPWLAKNPKPPSPKSKPQPLTHRTTLNPLTMALRTRPAAEKLPGAWCQSRVQIKLVWSGQVHSAGVQDHYYFFWKALFRIRSTQNGRRPAPTNCDGPGTRDWPLPGPIQELAPDP